MSGSGNTEREREAESTRQREEAPLEERRAGKTRREGPAEWVASTALRLGLAILGIALLVFAVGQILDVPLFDVLDDALSSQVVLWIVVGLFALLLLGLAARGFSYRRR
jgi:hypothetical protein